jgi:hypothetical protein
MPAMRLARVAIVLAVGLVVTGANAVRAQGPTAKLSGSVPAKISISGEGSGPIIHVRYTGPSGGIPPVPVNLRAAAEPGLLRVAQARFATAEVVNEGTAPSDALVIDIRVASGSYTTHWTDMDVSYTVTFTAHSSAGGRFTRTEAQQAKGKFDHSMFSASHNMASIAEHLPRTLSASLVEALSRLLDSTDTTAFIQSEASQLVADATPLGELKPCYATYRVTEADAAIRKRPNAKAATVRKLAIGSVVSVIGQLPEGWLQVSREGEAIGWVHRDSVSLVSEQPMGSTPTAARPATADAIELAFWDSVKNSANPADIQAYLQRFPSGNFAALARSRLASLGEPARVRTAPLPLPGGGVDFGRYHALVIGNDNYRSVTKLKTAVADARAVAALLQNDYGFKVTLLLDATRNQMLDAFDDLRRQLTDRDNLLIYYAGHGYLDTDSDRGFWMPVDADRHRRANWLSNSDLADTVRATRAKHVLVVADSCYAGTITRSLSVEVSSLDDMSRLAQKRARTVLTSGGLEPVEDSGGGGHSVFAKAFLSALRKNTGVADMSQLFSDMRREVLLSSPQTPQYGDIRQTGHEGGDFIFVRRK